MYIYHTFFFTPSSFLPSSSISSIYNIDEKALAGCWHSPSIINVPQRPAVEMVHQSMKRNRDLFFYMIYTTVDEQKERKNEWIYNDIEKRRMDGARSILRSSF